MIYGCVADCRISVLEYVKKGAGIHNGDGTRTVSAALKKVL